MRNCLVLDLISLVHGYGIWTCCFNPLFNPMVHNLPLYRYGILLFNNILLFLWFCIVPFAWIHDVSVLSFSCDSMILFRGTSFCYYCSIPIGHSCVIDIKLYYFLVVHSLYWFSLEVQGLKLIVYENWASNVWIALIFNIGYSII